MNLAPVYPGENTSDVAARFGVSSLALVRENPHKDRISTKHSLAFAELKEGELLRVPLRPGSLGDATDDLAQAVLDKLQSGLTQALDPVVQQIIVDRTSQIQQLADSVAAQTLSDLQPQMQQMTNQIAAQTLQANLPAMQSTMQDFINQQVQALTSQIGPLADDIVSRELPAVQQAVQDKVLSTLQSSQIQDFLGQQQTKLAWTLLATSAATAVATWFLVRNFGGK